MSANILSRTSLSLAAIGMFFGTSALAADYTFPSAGGDISSQDAWGGHLPEAGDTATFNQAGTYTASADVALPTVVVKKNGIVFAMTNEPTRTVTLTGDDAIKTQIANGRVEYRGGVWCATSASSTFSVGANSTYYGNEMALNGATFADFANVYVGFKSSSSDALILTKPLGVGILTTAAKADLVEKELMDVIYRQMATLNKAARDIMVTYPVHSCTDVTGFALLGHSYEMAQGSECTIHLQAKNIPFHAKALEFAQIGFIPAGAYRNRDYAQAGVKVGPDVSLAMEDICYDPQTSGGLLMALPAQYAEECLSKIRQVMPMAAIVGYVTEQEEYSVILE